MLRPGEAGERRLPCWRSDVHCRGAGWGAGFPVPRNGDRGIGTVFHGLLRPPAGPGRRPGARPAAASPACRRSVRAAGGVRAAQHATTATRGTSAAEVITRRAGRAWLLVIQRISVVKPKTRALRYLHLVSPAGSSRSWWRSELGTREQGERSADHNTRVKIFPGQLVPA